MMDPRSSSIEGGEAPGARPRDEPRESKLREVLIGVSLLVIVINLVVPLLVQLRLQLRASEVVADYLSIRAAATDYRDQTGLWPADAGPGRVPLELRPYLSGRLQWADGDLRYDWQNWVARDGRLRRPETGVAVGFTVQADDTRLLVMLERVWDGPLQPIYGWGVTFPIESAAPTSR